MSGRTVTMNIDGGLAVSRKLSQLSDQLPWIQRRAMATLRRRLPVYARRDMQAEYNIGARRVNQDLSSRIDGDTIKLTGHWRGIGLMNFGARETRKGVTASIMRGRRSLYPGAFKAPLASGNVQVVSRYGAKRLMTQGRYKGKMRQPLAVEYGATVAQMLAKGRRPERLADYAGTKLLEEAERIFDVRYGRKPPTTTG